MRRLLFVAVAALAAIQLPSASASGPRGPNVFTVGQGAVWVGYGDGRVVRVSARGRAVRMVVPPKLTGFVGGIALGFGSVWVARHDSTVVRLEGRTGRIQARLHLASMPGGLDAGYGAVWVGDGLRGRIFRVDPRKNRVRVAARVNGSLMGFTVGAGAVWIQTAPDPVTGFRGRRVLWRLDPAALTIARVRRAGCNLALHAARTKLWVLDNCDGSLRSLNTTTGRWSGPIRTLSRASSLTSAFGSVWVTDGSTVMRIGLRRRTRIDVGGHMLAGGPRALWALDTGNGITGWLRRIDPRTNRVAGSRIRLSAR